MCNAAVSFGSFLLACGAILSVAASAAAVDFPDVDSLPSVKELPDPLLMCDGKHVTTKEQWNDERKPELKALFQHYMYGLRRAIPRSTRPSFKWRAIVSAARRR